MYAFKESCVGLITLRLSHVIQFALFFSIMNNFGPIQGLPVPYKDNMVIVQTILKKCLH
jgi:hypothetical protein